MNNMKKKLHLGDFINKFEHNNKFTHQKPIILGQRLVRGIKPQTIKSSVNVS